MNCRFNHSYLLAVAVLLVLSMTTFCQGFSATTKPKKPPFIPSIDSQEYADAISVIDRASSSQTPSDDLYDAVRAIDRNARFVYPDEDAKEELWKRAYGSWRLVLATGGGKYTTFKKVPIFAFAMLDETNFGNGVGLTPDWIALSLLGPHELITNRRQMVINIDDVFLGGSKVTNRVPSFIGEGMGLGKRSNDWKTRPPAFVFLAASETSLVARGGSGGIAIWTRLYKDIRPSAYGSNTE